MKISFILLHFLPKHWPQWKIETLHKPKKRSTSKTSWWDGSPNKVLNKDILQVKNKNTPTGSLMLVYYFIVHFSPFLVNVPFLYPYNGQETYGFLFSRGIERGQWYEMGKTKLLMKVCIWFCTCICWKETEAAACSSSVRPASLLKKDAIVVVFLWILLFTTSFLQNTSGWRKSLAEFIFWKWNVKVNNKTMKTLQFLFHLTRFLCILRTFPTLKHQSEICWS